MLGAGDGFMSGLLKGWLTDQDWPTALKYANACGAFAVSRHGCTPAYPSWEELRFFLDRGVRMKALRKDPELEQIHWSTNRLGDWPEMRVFAFDHRMQLEAVADELGVDRDRIGAFKELCLKAARQVAAGRPGYGILCDGRLGRDALYAAAGTGLWIGRPVEYPGSRPLRLEDDIEPDFGSALAEWPVEHVVKVLAFYHPDDDAEMKSEQEATVTRLFHACPRQPPRVPAGDHPVEGRAGHRHHLGRDHPALLRPRGLSRLVEARADEDRRRLGQRLRRDHPQRPAHPRHRRPRPRGPDRRAGGELRRRRPPRPRQGLRGRPHHLRRRRPGLARRRDHRPGGRRRHGRKVRPPLPDLGRGSEGARKGAAA